MQNRGAFRWPLTLVLPFLVFMALPSAALAELPWNWQMRLAVERAGDSMYMPSALAFDEQSQRYYVVDTGRSRLVSFGHDGKFLRAFTADDRLKSPFDMVRLDNGQLWVVEKGRNSLTLIDVAAKKVEPHILQDGEHLIFPARLKHAGGRLYVLDRASGEILRLKEDLSVEQRFGCQDCSAGMVDFVLSGDSLWALEPRDKKIFRFRLDGSLVEEIALNDEIGFPVSLAIGPGGEFYVLDRHLNNLHVYDETGRFQYRFLGSGQAPGKVYFASQVRFDPWGRLCVVDEGNGRVEIFSR